MSTSTVETVETSGPGSDNFEIWHHFAKEEAFKRIIGEPHETTCGFKIIPKTPKKIHPTSGSSLGPMEKCVICQTILASRK